MTQTITVTNPVTLQREKKLVLIPKEEYQALIRIKRKGIPGITLAKRQKNAVLESEKELRRGEFFTLNELNQYLARPRAKTSR